MKSEKIIKMVTYVCILFIIVISKPCLALPKEIPDLEKITKEREMLTEMRKKIKDKISSEKLSKAEITRLKNIDIRIKKIDTKLKMRHGRNMAKRQDIIKKQDKEIAPEKPEYTSKGYLYVLMITTIFIMIYFRNKLKILYTMLIENYNEFCEKEEKTISKIPIIKKFIVMDPITSSNPSDGKIHMENIY